MTPLRELRYDRVTLYPRPRFHRGARRRDPSCHLSEIFPPIRIADFLPRRKKRRRNPGRDTGGDAAAAGADQPRKPRLSTPEPSLECGICGSSEEDEDDDEEEEEDDESNATARYVVGPDSIRFLAPVDQGSLVVFDRWREVHVPSPWSHSYWSKRQEPWQRFYLDRGAGRHSRWWMEVELAFASARASIDAPPCSAKRRCLSPADDSAAAAPGVQPLGQDSGSGAAEDDRGRDADWSRTEDREI